MLGWSAGSTRAQDWLVDVHRNWIQLQDACTVWRLVSILSKWLSATWGFAREASIYLKVWTLIAILLSRQLSSPHRARDGIVLSWNSRCANNPPLPCCARFAQRAFLLVESETLWRGATAGPHRKGLTCCRLTHHQAGVGQETSLKASTSG